MKELLYLVLLTVVTFVTPAQFSWAYQAGDVIVRVGPITVDPYDVSSRDLRLNESRLPGTEIDTIGSDTQLGITGTYMFTSYFGLDLLAATPFEHQIRAKGLEALGIRNVGKTKQLPPTLTAAFYPLGVLKPESKFQPYAGVGINFTFFFDEEASSQVERAFGEKFRLDLDNSIGPSLQFGLDYAFTDHLLLSAVAWRMQIQTDAKLRGRETGTRIDAKGVELDPWSLHDRARLQVLMRNHALRMQHGHGRSLMAVRLINCSLTLTKTVRPDISTAWQDIHHTNCSK